MRIMLLITASLIFCLILCNCASGATYYEGVVVDKRVGQTGGGLIPISDVYYLTLEKENGENIEVSTNQKTYLESDIGDNVRIKYDAPGLYDDMINDIIDNPIPSLIGLLISLIIGTIIYLTISYGGSDYDEDDEDWEDFIFEEGEDDE